MKKGCQNLTINPNKTTWTSGKQFTAFTALEVGTTEHSRHVAEHISVFVCKRNTTRASVSNTQNSHSVDRLPFSLCVCVCILRRRMKLYNYKTENLLSMTTICKCARYPHLLFLLLLISLDPCKNSLEEKETLCVSLIRYQHNYIWVFFCSFRSDLNT